ncbi:MAG: hypothetical protein ACKVU4_08735 [Phycisphaerales bacterium]
MTLAESLMPGWFVLPVATVLMLLLTAHALALAASDMDTRRRRIRLANNILMMITTPLIAYGFGIVDPQDGRRFVLVWTVAPLLLLMVIALAAADMVNTMALTRRERRDATRRMAPAPTPTGAESPEPGRD